jgi:S-adenosylmethionine hydrolase
MRKCVVFIAWSLGSALFAADGSQPLVLQTDFGTKDGAVAAMKGVAMGVSTRLVIHDLSHENTPYDIWEAAYRLKQTAAYWPAGTVFVSVVDPGVGSARKSVVLQTNSGHYFVGPDNGTWTLVAEDLGIAAVREIAPARHRREGSQKSHTFHGRDIYALVGARLAAGQIIFAEVGDRLPNEVVKLDYERPRAEGDGLTGTIPALDVQYGNVWTNIDEALFASLAPEFGDRFHVRISRGGHVVYENEIPYVRTFADVPTGAPLLYLNSLLNVALALNRDSFATKHGIASGAEWSVRLSKVRP